MLKEPVYCVDSWILNVFRDVREAITSEYNSQNIYIYINIISWKFYSKNITIIFFFSPHFVLRDTIKKNSPPRNNYQQLNYLGSSLIDLMLKATEWWSRCNFLGVLHLWNRKWENGSANRAPIKLDGLGVRAACSLSLLPGISCSMATNFVRRGDEVPVD